MAHVKSVKGFLTKCCFYLCFYFVLYLYPKCGYLYITVSLPSLSPFSLKVIFFQEFPDPDEKEKVENPSKEEYEVAKWLRNNVPIKKTKFLNHNVQYFTGSKAVDALMSSKWGSVVKEGEEPFFASREHCIDFLDLMLRHKFYHRARKVPVTEDQLRSLKKGKKAVTGTEKVTGTTEKKNGGEEKKEEEVAESSHAEGKALEVIIGEEDRKKKRRKVRLEMHMDQYFADTLDAYVWIYDPIPVHYWLFGALVVLAAIGICMFPLWPPGVRMVVYYLSVMAAGFLVFIIALAVLRFIVFCLIWILSLGKHHLWLFPNLTEDVGFFASFWPIYHYEYKDGTTSSGAKKKKKKDKQSDNEDDYGKDSMDNKEEQEGSTELGDEDERQEDEEREAEVEVGGSGGSGSESSESSSQQSQTGKDFEMVEKSELEQHQ
ncbi:hypothetical protein AAG570_009964 [Ranatra chinensis]|uniref:Translocation protein SEC62 n=1 Tax=Ranatra chinensis TaxID=642074 RepID=A0ABD0YQM5_9HEMI